MSTTPNATWLTEGRYVSDGGLETDLIFNRGVDLPEFASFPLVESDRGRALLRDYYDGYAAVARRAGVGLTLEAPTWRANPDWGAPARVRPRRAGPGEPCGGRVPHELRDSYADLADVRVIGAIGPRGDGYVAGERGRPRGGGGLPPPRRWRRSPPPGPTWSRRTPSPAPDEGRDRARRAASRGPGAGRVHRRDRWPAAGRNDPARRGRPRRGPGAAGRVRRQLRPPDPHRAGARGGRMARSHRPGEPERVHAQPRRARRGRGAGHGRSRPARRVVRRSPRATSRS